MFYNSNSINSLDVTNWNTNNVVSFSSTFEKASIKSLEGIESLDTSSAADMSYMFSNLYVPFNYDLSTKELTREDGTKYIAWDTANVEYMSELDPVPEWCPYYIQKG